MEVLSKSEILNVIRNVTVMNINAHFNKLVWEYKGSNDKSEYKTEKSANNSEDKAKNSEQSLHHNNP